MGIRVRGYPKTSTLLPMDISLALGEGFWYFRTRTVDASGRESDWTLEASRVVNPGGESVGLRLTPVTVRANGDPILVVRYMELEYGQTTGALNLSNKYYTF